MNLYVLLYLLVTGASAVYDINVATLEKPTNEFHNTDLSSELRICPYGLDEPNIADLDPFFLGTIYFQGPRKKCLSADDTALMSARKDFDKLVPKSYPSCMSSDSAAHMLMRYWNTVNQVVHQMSDAKTQLQLERAFYDTLGGYLRFYLVPTAQVSFYAGRLTLNTVERLVAIKRECQAVLHTDGTGWRAPSSKDLMNQVKTAKIEPISLGIESANNCDELDLGGPSKESGLSDHSQESDLNGHSQESDLNAHSQESDLNAHSQQSVVSVLLQESGLSGPPQESDMSSRSKYLDHGKTTMPLPYVDPVDANGHLSTIFLPFHQNRFYNLLLPSSAFELVRFYRTVTGCHRFLGLNQAKYNDKLLDWIGEIVNLHLADEEFYPGLGGVLQIQESLLQTKKSAEQTKKSAVQTKMSAVQTQKSSVQKEPKPKDSSKQGRSIDVRQVEGKPDSEEADYMAEFLFVPASVVLMVIFIIIIFFLHCGRRCGRKKPKVSDDVEAAVHTKVSKPRRAKKDKRERVKMKVEKSPLRSAKGRHYYGLPSKSSDDYSTSSLGIQFREKIMPFRCEGARGKNRSEYRYSRVSSEHYEDEMQPIWGGNGDKEKKRSSRGK